MTFLETPDRYTRGMHVINVVFKKENWSSDDIDTSLPIPPLSPNFHKWSLYGRISYTTAVPPYPEIGRSQSISTDGIREERIN